MAADDPARPAGSDSQWTRVTRRGKRSKPPGKTQQPPPAGPVENFRPNVSPQLSVDDIRWNHEKAVSKWRSAGSFECLCDVVKKNAPSHIHITKAVCLGIGAFDPEDGSWLAQRRAHIQLDAFLAMIRTLQETSSQEIECFYQEPRFAQPDKDYIASLGGKVVESPASYDLIDEKTLVFGIHLYRDIWAAALKNNLPGMFVGTGWDVWQETPGADKSFDFERIREMHHSYDMIPFPQDDSVSFSSTCIYWGQRVASDKKNANCF